MNPNQMLDMIQAVMTRDKECLKRKCQTLEASILYFGAKYKNKMSPELLKEYKEFFGIETVREGKI